MGEDGGDRWELVFEGEGPGADAEAEVPDIVVVSRTDRTGPGGHHVYADETGIILAEISDQGEVRILASGAHQALPRPVQARRP